MWNRTPSFREAICSVAGSVSWVQGPTSSCKTYYDRTNRKQANFAESRDTFDIDFIHHLTLPGRQDFLWGLGARLSSGNVSEVVPTVVFTPNHYTDKLYSAFFQDEIHIVGDQLSLTIGSKFLHNGYSGFEIEPAARLLWTPSSRQTVWGAVTRAVRTPSASKKTSSSPDWRRRLP